MKFKIFFLILILSMGFISAASPIDVVEKHYESFAKEDWNSYIGTFMEMDEKIIAEKKENVENMWKVFDTVSYEIYGITIEEIDDFSLVSYTANFVISFSDGSGSVADSRDFSALLLNENGWKIGFVGDKKGIQRAINEMAEENDNITVEEVQNVDFCGDGVCELDEECEVDCREIIYECSDCNVGEVEDVSKIDDEVLVCSFDDSFLDLDNFEITEEIWMSIPEFVREKFVEGGRIEIVIDGISYYFRVEERVIYSGYLEEVDYVIESSSCVVSSLVEGDLDFMSAYNQGLIKVSGGDFGSKIAVFFGNFGFEVFSFFDKTPREFIIEAESGVLKNAGRWSSIGIASSRGVEELYLGTGGSSVHYNFKSPFKGRAEFWVKVSDDGLHRDGARSVEIDLNDEKMDYDHKSVDYYSSGDIWGWEKVGVVDLKKDNVLSFKKSEQTSAAFVMDSFKFIEIK